MSLTPGYKSKRRLLMVAIKREADAVGTDYIANGATPMAMMTKGLSVDPLITEQISRDLDTGENGGQRVIHTGEMIKVSGAVELAGSGAVNAPVAYAPLYQMAGHDVNTDVATEVSYNRILSLSDEVDGVMYFYWEGKYHILLSGKASLSTSAKIGELAYENFEATGIYGGTLKSAIPTADFSAFSSPLPVSTANTEFVLDGQNLNLVEFEEAQNNSVEYDEGTELKRMFIDDWNIEGRVLIEAADLDLFDPYAILLGNALLPYTFTHGLTDGAITKKESTGMQFLTVKPGEHKGKEMYDITYRVVRGHDTKHTSL